MLLCEDFRMKAALSQAASPQASRITRVRNRRIVEARERLGHSTMRAAAEAVGVAYETFVRFEHGDIDPLGADDMWRDAALTIAEGLYAMPEELWPAAAKRIEQVRRQSETASEQMRDAVVDGEQALVTLRDVEHVRKVLNELPERLRTIVLEHCNGKTLVEIGHRFDLSRERVRQIVVHGINEVRDRMPRESDRPVLKKIPTPLKLAGCNKCKCTDNLQSVETEDGRRIYTCGTCRYTPLEPTAPENKARRERLYEGRPPGAYVVPNWWTGFGLREMVQDYRDRDLLYSARATPLELAHWVETGELPSRCQAMRDAG